MEITIYTFSGRGYMNDNEWIDQFDMPYTGTAQAAVASTIKALENAAKLPYDVKDVGINIYTERRDREGFRPYIISAHTIDELIIKILNNKISEDI